MTFTGALILIVCALLIGSVLAFVGSYRRQGALMSARGVRGATAAPTLAHTLKQPITVAPAFLLIGLLCLLRLLPWWSLAVFAAAEAVALLGLIVLTVRRRRRTSTR